MTSELRVDNLKGSTTGGSINVLGEGTSATTNLQQGLTKAWVNLNGTGTIATRDSFNVSSIDDDGTGLYSYNLSSAMGNSNYNCNSNAGTTSIGTTNRAASSIPENASSVLIGCRNMSNGAIDVENMHGNINGDLA